MSSESTPRTTPAGSSSSDYTGSDYTPSHSSGSPTSLSFSTSSFVSHPRTPSPHSVSSAHSDLDSDLNDIDDDRQSLASYTSYDEAEAEWRESLQQLELLVTLVLIPFVGKWIGRKCAYWVWGRVMTWKHPNLEMVVTNRGAFNAVGAISASAPL